MIVRDARPADAEAVRRLIGQLADEPDAAEFRHRFESVSSAAGHRMIVAEAAGKVVGVLHVFERPALEKPREAVVQALVVDSGARSTGVGEALMREAETWRGAASSRRHRSTAASTASGRTPSTSASAIG